MFGKPFLILFFLFCIFLFANPISAQNSFTELENKDIFSTDDEIINGEQWVYQKKYAGHPFWKEDNWYQAEIVYHGQKFENVSVRYDLYSQNIIILKKLKNETRAYTLNKEFLQSFKLFDNTNGETFVFEYKTLSNNTGREIYYHAFRGGANYYLNYRKSINNRITNNYPGEFIFTPVLLAEIDGNLKEFKSNAEFLNLFGDKKAEIKKFMRQNRIKFKKQMPEELIPVFAYFDSITHPSPAKL